MTSRPILRLLGSLWLLAACGAEQRPWNVLLVTFDTTRADAIGCYGARGARTPTIDALAAEGVRFRHAYSPIPITLPSHASIMTGQYPPAHGVRDNGLFVLPAEQVTLAERLAARGYATAAAIGAFPLVAKFGIDQGFALFDDRLESGEFRDPLAQGGVAPARLFFEERRAELVNEALYPWLDEHRDDPFFAWVHYYDPHQPLVPPAPYDQLFAGDPYAGEIAYADEALGALLGRLEDLGVLERTLVVFTSDHGEGLGEHQETTHSYLVYNSTLHVPLVIRPPGAGEPRVIDSRVRTVDIAPTILDLLGFPVPADLHGRSLARHVRGDLDEASRPHYAETLSPRLTNDWGELRALYDGRWKYIHGPRSELYDVETDPAELDDRLAAEPEVATAMRQKLERFLADHAGASAVAAASPDPETVQRLQALGYLTGSGEGVHEIREELRSDGVAPQDRIGDVSMMSAARDALVRGKPVVARQYADWLLERDPENRYRLEILAHAQFMLGALDEGLATVERILVDGPSSGSAEALMLAASQRLYAAGRVEEALRYARRSLELEPGAAGYYFLASVLAWEGRHDEAGEALGRVLELDPEHSPALVDRGVRRAQEGRIEGASTDFLAALRAQPYYPKAHYNYGAFLLQEGRAAEALSYFRRAFDLQADYLEAYHAAIVAQLALADVEGARSTLRDLESVAPASSAAAAASSLLESS